MEVTVEEFSLSLGGRWTSTKWKLVGVKVKPQLYGKLKVPGESVGEKSVGGEQVTTEIIWIFIFQF